MVLKHYMGTLDSKSLARYIEKLKTIDSIDPYTLSPSDFDGAVNLPGLGSEAILEFLLFRVSPFTQNEINAHKSLSAFAQVACKWVKEIKTKTFGEQVLVLGKVLHSQKLNQTPLTPWIVICNDKVIAAQCNCIAGLGEACTHVASLLFLIAKSGEGPKSVTDTLAYWIGSGKKDVHLAVSEMNFQTPKKIFTSEVEIAKRREKEELPNVNEKISFSQNDVVNFLQKYKEAGCDSVLHLILEPFISQAKTNMFTALYKETYEKLSLEQLCEIAKTLTFKLSEADAVQLEKETRKQNKSEKWFEARKGRITASILKEVCHTNVEKPSKSIIKKICYPQKISVKETVYGCMHEGDAIKAYLKLHKQKHAGSEY